MPVPQREHLKRQLSVSSDMLQLLTYLSDAEIDKVLMLQDRLMTYEYVKQSSHSYDTMFDKALEQAKRESEKRFKALDNDPS